MLWFSNCHFKNQCIAVFLSTNLHGFLSLTSNWILINKLSERLQINKHIIQLLNFCLKLPQFTSLVKFSFQSAISISKNQCLSVAFSTFGTGDSKVKQEVKMMLCQGSNFPLTRKQYNLFPPAIYFTDLILKEELNGNDSNKLTNFVKYMSQLPF